MIDSNKVHSTFSYNNNVIIQNRMLPEINMLERGEGDENFRKGFDLNKCKYKQLTLFF